MTAVMRNEDPPRAAQSLQEAFEPFVGGDWNGRAGDVDWSCRDTLDHVANALCSYSVHLATCTRQRRPRPRDGNPNASPQELLQTVGDFAVLLALVAEACPPGTRAFHPAGLADPDGFVAMGCDEILVHGYDLSLGLDVGYQPPADLVGRVRSRLFPWAPTAGDPWGALLWANGRIAWGDRERLGPAWWWQCVPLDEWDGDLRRRSELDPPGWR